MSNNSGHRIDIEPRGLGDSGHRYRVIHNGVTLIESTKNPEFDAARALLAKGITGRLEIWRQGASDRAILLDIRRAAELTVEDGDKAGPRFTRWQPRSVEPSTNAVSASGGSARTGGWKGAAGTLARKKSPVLDRPSPSNSSLAVREDGLRQLELFP